MKKVRNKDREVHQKETHSNEWVLLFILQKRFEKQTLNTEPES